MEPPGDDAAAAIDKAIAAFAKGDYVIVRYGVEGNQGCCLAFAAEHATDERVAFLIRQSTGVVSAALDSDKLKIFGMEAMANSGCLSADFLPGRATGMSAKDRASTLRALCDMSNSASSFIKPGHTFIVPVSKRGVLDSQGRAEAIYDLCRLSQVAPVGVFADMMHDDGTMYTPQDVAAFSRSHSAPVVILDELCNYCRHREGLLAASARKTTMDGESKIWIDDIDTECRIRFYSTSDPKVEIIAVSKGELRDQEGVPVRLHSECFTGDIFGSRRCDCGQQLHKFLKVMNDKPFGVMLYAKGHEGRGIGLLNKLRAYKLQDEGYDTVDANLKLGLPVDTRSYEDAVAVIRDLGIKSISLYTNNPEKQEAFRSLTKEVVPLSSVPCQQNINYLKTKTERLNHKTVLETFKLPTLKMDSSKLCVGIVYTTWNEYYVKRMLEEVQSVFNDAGVRYAKLAVPGGLDLVSGAKALLRRNKVDVVLLLGVFIKGSSDMHEVTCNALMNTIMHMNSAQDIPIVSGVLMCRDEEQANERATKNPAAWAKTALHMAQVSRDTDTCQENGSAPGRI